MPNPKKTKSQRRPRKLHERKPKRPGIKSLRGQPELYDELKKVISISITPTAKAGLICLSEQRNISLSELIERIGRQLIQLSDPAFLDSSRPFSTTHNSSPDSLELINKS